MTRDGIVEETEPAGPAPRLGTVSIRDVAARAGVSIATVSNVLNNRPRVGEALVLRVREAVQDLGYVANGAASRLRSRRPALAGVLVPDLATPMFGAFVTTLEDLAREDGFDLIVASCRNDAALEAERLAALCAWRPAGCIVIPVDGALGARRPRGFDMPIVAVDRIPDEPGVDLIAADNAVSSEGMLRHLAAQGFRRVLAVAYDLGVTNMQERWRGAVAGAAGAVDLELLVAGFDVPRRREVVRARLAGGSWPDAIFSLDHVTTLAVFETLAALGAEAASRVALASFDDNAWMRLVAPAITAIRQPVEEMAEAAWARLMRRMTGDTSPPTARRLSCRLIVRQSTAARQLTL